MDQEQLSAKAYTRKRIIGTEQEYGIWSKNRKIEWRINGEFRYKWLTNGGLVYEDCGHPEYASPEASNPLDAMKYSKAGESLVKNSVRNSKQHDFFKHVSDGFRIGSGIIHGRGSFGAHESYSLDAFLDISARSSFFQGILPFFTTRIIYAGAGGIDCGTYEISQRKERTKNMITLAREERYNSHSEDYRAFFKVKDEWNSNRLHVTCGDANMSEVAEYLKLGTTALVLDLAEDEQLKNSFKFIDLLKDFPKISRDLTLKKRFETNRGKMTAIEVQRYYQELAQANYNGRDKMTDDILTRWKFVLDTLETDPMKLDRQIDWVIKKKLIDSYMNKTEKSITDSSVKNINLMYHDTDKSKGLFYLLQNKGLVDRLLTGEQIKHAVNNAPEDTRAWIRGAFIKKYGGVGISKNGSSLLYWNYVMLCTRFEEKIDNPFDNYKRLETKL
jgi:hypothetical protein